MSKTTSPTATTLPNFNPSNNAAVSLIKRDTEDLINFVRNMPDANQRCVALALTNYEQAAMWAVKSLHVKQEEEATPNE